MTPSDSPLRSALERLGHRPAGEGDLCLHRWRNRTTRAVHCKFLAGWLAALAADPAPPAESTFWLIERGQGEHQVPTVWWTSDTWSSEGEWTTFATKAERFPDQATAEAFIEQHSPIPSRQPRFGRATEHGFMAPSSEGETVEGLRRQVGIQLTDARVDEWVRGMRVPLHGREVSVDLQSRYLAVTIRAAVLTLIDDVAALRPASPSPEPEYPECPRCGSTRLTHRAGCTYRATVPYPNTEGPITTPSGDELERGAPDYPGQ